MLAAKSLSRAFLYTWLFFIGLSIISPIQYESGYSFYSYIMSSGYVVFSLIIGVLFSQVFSSPRRKYIQINRSRYTEKLLLLLLTLSLVGAVLLWVDKTIVKGIDYSQGVAQARVQWGANEGVRSGVSSIYSLGGYLIGFYYFVVAYAVLMYRESYSSKFFYSSLLFCFVLVLFNSYMTGGRSIILVFLILLASTIFVRRTIGLPKLNINVGFLRSLLVFVFLGLVMVYSVYIVYSRAKMSSIDSGEYLDAVVTHLNGQVLLEISNDFVNYFMVIVAYLVHPFWVFEESLSLTARPGQVVFVFLTSLLSKAGFVSGVDSDYVFHGLFLSVPGAFHYEFGIVGYILIIVITGLLLGIVSSLRHGGDISRILLVLIGMFLLSSPLLFIFDFMATFFVIWAFFSCLLFHLSYSWIRIR